MFLLACHGLVLTLPISLATAFGTNSTIDGQLKNVAHSQTNRGSLVDIFYVTTPALFIFFSTVVLLSAFNYIRKKKNIAELLKEENKKKALGNSYGSCTTQEKEKEPLYELLHNSRNGTLAHVINMAYDKQMQPYNIHPVL